MAWYTKGTVSVTKNSSTVTGSGTNWVENIRVGDGFNGPDGKMYQITNVTSNTSITIAPAYVGSSASGQPYAVVPVQGYVKKAADRLVLVVNELEAMPTDIVSLQTSVTSLNQSISTINDTQIIAGTGLTGGGTLAANRTLNVTYGTTAGTAAQGNDSRITGSMQKSANLSDLTDTAEARDNLGLGNVDNTSDIDKPISSAAQTELAKKVDKANNLSDLQDATTARNNLGLGNVDNTSDKDKPVSNDTLTALDLKVDKANNLSDLQDTSTARDNLGLGTAATADIVGTMSSGAIIESGSNENGEYVKFADGTMVCGFEYRISGTGWKTTRPTFYFAAPFVTIPYITYSCLSDDTAWSGVASIYRTNRSNDSFQIRPPIGITDTGTSVEITGVAFGRWKD